MDAELPVHQVFQDILRKPIRYKKDGKYKTEIPDIRIVLPYDMYYYEGAHKELMQRIGEFAAIDTKKIICEEGHEYPKALPFFKHPLKHIKARVMRATIWLVRECLLLPFRPLGFTRPEQYDKKYMYARAWHTLIIGSKKDRHYKTESGEIKECR